MFIIAATCQIHIMSHLWCMGFPRSSSFSSCCSSSQLFSKWKRKSGGSGWSSFTRCLQCLRSCNCSRSRGRSLRKERGGHYWRWRRHTGKSDRRRSRSTPPTSWGTVEIAQTTSVSGLQSRGIEYRFSGYRNLTTASYCRTYQYRSLTTVTRLQYPTVPWMRCTQLRIRRGARWGRRWGRQSIREGDGEGPDGGPSLWPRRLLRLPLYGGSTSNDEVCDWWCDTVPIAPS